MDESTQVDYIFKYILVGDTSVGKSSLLSIFTTNQFHNQSNPTMGVQFAIKKLEMNGKLIKLQIWDTAGQESFRTITRAYYKNAIGVLLVYDLTSPKSVQNLESWLAEIQQNSNDKVEVVIVGNKNDKGDGSDLLLPQSINRFKKYNTSAKTGHNVTKVFGQLTATILNKLQNGEITADGTHGVKRGNLIGKALRLNEINEQGPKYNCC